MDGFSISMLDEYDSLCEEASPFLTSASTQTAGEQPARKIKPIKHPALKLKSPIAYQKDTDLSVIPIQRDGMGKSVSRSRKRRDGNACCCTLVIRRQ
jgi:hypothetical protein